LIKGVLPAGYRMKTIKRIIGFIFLIILVIIGMAIYSGYEKYKEAVSQTSVEAAVENIRAEENYTTLYDVPQIYKDAVVAVEDRRFYYHGGFDIIGTARAILTDLKHKELLEGGSTITQQLAKNMYFEGENSPERKIAEIFVALELEKKYTKDEILELYFNGIYYGSGYYNIYDASMGYFNKEPSEMTRAEATLLAGVPNAPSVYSPKNNPDLALKRREKVLKSMVEGGYITEEEAEKIPDEI